jgi:hypothetical protein
MAEPSFPRRASQPNCRLLPLWFLSCPRRPSALRGTPRATPTTGVFNLPFATPASKSIHGRSRLLSVKRHTTSEVDCSFSISRLYHSSPKSMPSDPFLSDERNVLIIAALTLFSNLPNASASSESLASWLTKTSGPPVVDEECAPRGVFWIVRLTHGLSLPF